MTYNRPMTLLLAAFFLFSGPARADVDPAATSADTTTLRIVEVVLKAPTTDIDPRLIGPFMAVDAQSLPRKLRRKTQAKQIEISTLLKLHDTKKAGNFVQPLEGCSEKNFVLPLEQAGLYATIGYEEINEDELKYVMDKTTCKEIDLGCRFSLKIFFKTGKDRRLMFYASDPIMALVAESRGKGGNGTRFFGVGITCMH